MDALCLTAWNRPNLLRRLLNTLTKQDDLTGWQLFVQVEPSDQQQHILHLLRTEAPSLTVHLMINHERLGVRANPIRCLERAADAGADHFLLLEDDLELSEDALSFCRMLWTNKNFSERYACGNLHFSTCFNQSHLQNWDASIKELPEIALETFFLSSLGLFFTRAQFQRLIQPHWWDEPLKLRSFFGDRVSGWDCALNQAILLQSRPVLQSLLPRVRHCGVEGVHSDAELHQRSYAHAGLHQADRPLQQIRIHNVDEINATPPDDCRHWGHLLRLGCHLWTLQKQQLRQNLQLARCQKNLKQLLNERIQ